LCRIGFAASRRLLEIEQVSHDRVLGADAFGHLQRPREIAAQRAAALRLSDAKAQALLIQVGQAIQSNPADPAPQERRRCRTSSAPSSSTPST
jgi:hypothetical protein